MKKLILILLAFFLSSVTVMMNAQTINKNQHPVSSNSAYGKTVGDENMWNYQHVELLKAQNKCLKSRKAALIVSACGAGVTIIGAALGNNQAGAVIAGIGGITTLSGGIWCLVNEFKLIETQKQINNHITLKFSPTSVAINF